MTHPKTVVTFIHENGPVTVPCSTLMICREDSDNELVVVRSEADRPSAQAMAESAIADLEAMAADARRRLCEMGLLVLDVDVKSSKPHELVRNLQRQNLEISELRHQLEAAEARIASLQGMVGLSLGERVSVVHESGTTETGTVEGITHRVAIAFPDGHYDAFPIEKVKKLSEGD